MNPQNRPCHNHHFSPGIAGFKSPETVENQRARLRSKSTRAVTALQHRRALALIELAYAVDKAIDTRRKAAR
jgi:hypothetical protein